MIQYSLHSEVFLAIFNEGKWLWLSMTRVIVPFKKAYVEYIMYPKSLRKSQSVGYRINPLNNGEWAQPFRHKFGRARRFEPNVLSAKHHFVSGLKL